jgi:hypothetical protein
MSGTNEQAKFLSGNLTKHIISMSLTSAIGFLALFVVDLVDMLFKPAVSRAMYEGRLWAGSVSGEEEALAPCCTVHILEVRAGRRRSLHARAQQVVLPQAEL